MKNIKKLIVATSLFIGSLAFAQAPEKMSYQAVVRNTTNNLLVSQNVGMQISILQGSATGTAVYVETQTPTSNTNGLVTIEIGGGTVVSGNFTTINWANGPYFIKTETDPTGGTSYTITGTSQLLSTPYALYAKTSGSSTPGPQGPAGATGPSGTNGLDGATGPAGPAGPAGDNGTNGLDGATGPMGPQGPQGLTGPTGATGATGANGTNGTNGLDGATGPMGPQGPQGLTGPVGANGTNGLDGATGPMGPQGPQGLTGPTGATGANGTNGLDGATGPMGPQGPQGLTGPTGATGANGTNGVDGTNGLDGATGPMGPQGPQGIQGLTGPAGTNGANGATGPMGPQGLTGPTGATGANGTNGLDGATGPMGPQGIQGLTGPAGANGTNGLDGATGPMGPQGIQGLTGPAGANGTNGLDGATGPMGPQGPAGTPGANGQGVPVGGTTGQVLAKVDGTDYNTQWVTPATSGSDNLGNHTATTTLNMNSNAITGATNITATGTATLGGNIYPTNTGTNGQVLTTNGAGALSWGTAGGGAQTILRANATTAQTFPFGSSLTNPDVATCFNNEIVDSSNSFTSGVFTAPNTGLYFITIQTTSLNAQLIPMVDVGNNGIGGEDYYGTGLTNNNLQNPYKSRGQLQCMVFLTSGQIFSVRLNNSSNVITLPNSTDGSTNISIVKLN